MKGLFLSLAVFVSAALIMLVQPLAGKTLLPATGGTPAVWNTCLVVFQALLLAGYAYADRLSRLAFRTQVVVHVAVVALGLLAINVLTPLADTEWVPAESEYPIPGLVLFLLAFLGLPFFALAPTSPLLQAWFSRTAANPYLLYAAGNVGSMLGLLAYPFLIEPLLTLKEQITATSLGLMVLLPLLLLSAWLVRNRVHDVESMVATTGIAISTRLRWLILAAIPSSLLMGVSTHLTTDIAPMPLLWVLPLALYLGSFVVVFTWWPEQARTLAGRFVPMLLVFLTLALITAATEPMLVVAGLHLTAFFGVALLCHGELAATRPGKEQLTTFYLTLSLGGVLGGLFNALAAPLVFSHFGLVEYPLVVLLSALVRPFGTDWAFPKRDIYWLGVFTVILVSLNIFVPRILPVPASLETPEGLLQWAARVGLMFGIPAMLAFALVLRPMRFTLCLAALFIAGACDTGPHGETLLRTRNFFGTLRVTRSLDGKLVKLVHGTTQHGQERLDETGAPRPLMYYHRKGPVGHFFARFPAPKRVAAVGLGVGAMADYVAAESHWTFYEIDPAVVHIARDSGYFHYLQAAKGRVDITLGDARRKLAAEPDGTFDVIVLDAFSSDAIPVHLLTREALALYARKLTPTGVILCHLSNRYLDLVPLVARLGDDHTPPFRLKANQDSPSDGDREDGKFPSTWAILYRQPDHLGDTAKDVRFQTTPMTPGPIWRDDFSNLWAVWKWEE